MLSLHGSRSGQHAPNKLGLSKPNRVGAGKSRLFLAPLSPITGCIHLRERKSNTQYSSGHIYHEAYASFCMTRWSICPPISTLASIHARTSGTSAK
ncbi:hypothetical protein TSAR_008923 [Trichomalopsis sarcophagae]|uniref:Uncharacterized protein n=1 Tax=Trichomalopsis sarcophagae TaxID=543379 RepID=A0A232ER50_9HYME|nr:hypothetical protein TSAR_008923 [Trichomalopsis sarcophagae]